MYLMLLKKQKLKVEKLLLKVVFLEGEGYESGCYVKPAIIEAKNHFEIVQHETFAPILYLMKYSGDVKMQLQFKMVLLKDYLLLL
jgi:aldehyde dehydrogenase (NAD+)